MSRAIRKHLRDFVAIIALVVIAGVTGWVIVQNQRLRVPVLEEKPFELNVAMQTAQSVVAGQGQTVRVAGVRIGDVGAVNLKDGQGIVRMDIDTKYLPIYRNATVLLRPKTGLKDMFFELDPGDKSAGEFKSGGTVSAANTAPDINQDEIFTALDQDSRDYLKLLVSGFGKGLKGRGRDLGNVLQQLGPLNRSASKLNSVIAERRRNLARLVHNLNILTETLGNKDKELTALVRSSNQVFAAFAKEDANVSRTVALLPGTLRTTTNTLRKVDTFAQVLGPAATSLRPFASRLDDMNDSVRPFAKVAAPIVKNELRPFVRAARSPVANLRPAARELARAAPRQTTAFTDLNRLFNMAAYNPKGAEAPGAAGRDEGYLYWLAWLGHMSNSVFNIADAHSPTRKLYLSVNCLTIRETVNSTPAALIVQNFAAILANPTLCPT